MKNKIINSAGIIVIILTLVLIPACLFTSCRQANRVSDNVTYVVEDLNLGENEVSNYHYTLNYNPDMWLPVDIKTID